SGPLEPPDSLNFCMIAPCTTNCPVGVEMRVVDTSVVAARVSGDGELEQPATNTVAAAAITGTEYRVRAICSASPPRNTTPPSQCRSPDDNAGRFQSRGRT